MNNSIEKLPNGDFKVTPNEVYTDLEYGATPKLITAEQAKQLVNSHERGRIPSIYEEIKSTAVRGGTELFVHNIRNSLYSILKAELISCGYSVTRFSTGILIEWDDK